jgi:hypothetical protein
MRDPVVCDGRSNGAVDDAPGRAVMRRSRRDAPCHMARPTGVGRALTAYDLPIEGRDEWLAAATRLA